MAVNLSPLGGAGAQFFTNDGVPLTGGLLYTYLAGTSTPATTYTSGSGITALANPIILDAAGRVPTGEIWLSDGISYKFVLKDSTDVLIATWDGLSGINSNFIAFTAQEETATATAGQTVFNTTINYIPATNNLAVFVNGSNQIVNVNYLETDDNTVTFLTGLNVGDVVKFSTATPVATNAMDASNVSYTPAGVGAVTTNVQAKLRQTVSVKDFGAVGDGTTDDTTAIQNALDAVLSGGTLYFPSGNYWLGNLTDKQIALTIQSGTDINLVGDKATISCTSSGAAPVQSIMLYFIDPNRVTITGINFTDNGFSTAGWSSGTGWYGAYGVLVTTGLSGSPYTEQNPCRGFRISDCSATNMLSLVSFDSANLLGQGLGTPYSLANVVVDGWCDTTYYGVSYTRGCKHLRIDLDCFDVRRGLTSYGLQDCTASFTLQCSAGFNGSNGFVELAQDGSVYGDTLNCDIDVKVSGVEAHTAYVNFYHQTATPATGAIANIKANVWASELTTVGKLAGLGATNLFVFMHEYITVLPTTNSTWNQISLGGGIEGTISGKPIFIRTVPNTKGALSIYDDIGMKQAALGAADVAGIFTAFNVDICHIALPFTSTVQGLTTAGTATYSQSNGYCEIVNGRCFYDVYVAWTVATGTGQLAIGGLPVPWNKTRTGASTNPVGSSLGLPAGAGNVPSTLVAGDGTKIYCYAVAQTTGASSAIAVPASGAVFASGSFAV